jgi:hypothetical protein
MSRTLPSHWFRTSLEILETREMMAADSSVWRISAFLASASNDATVAAAQPAKSSTANTAAAPAATNSSTTSVGQYAVQGADWFSANLVDAALRDTARADASDGTLNRADMLAIFNQVKKDGVVSSSEFADLKRLVGQTAFFTGYDYVRVLSTDVILGSPANAHFQGQSLGNLSAGSSGSQLDKLVQKWFFGADHPTAMSGTTYKVATGSLFPHAPTYADIVQGSVGDCYLLASLGEVALRDPKLIMNMFIVNGDGTYTVTFSNNGRADYVTVDSMLPVTSQGTYVYANMGLSSSKSAPLWVALAEKAYAEMNESGWLRAAFGDKGHNSYDAIAGGYMTDALRQIDHRNTGFALVGESQFVAAWNAGSLITFGSFSRPHDTSIVGNHAYAVVGYNATTKLVTLFNPWGVNNRSAPGLVTLTWAQMSQDYFAMEYTT